MEKFCFEAEQSGKKLRACGVKETVSFLMVADSSLYLYVSWNDLIEKKLLV